MFRRIILTLTILSAGAALASAQLIDKPAATVRLYKLEVISVTQFRQKVDQLEQRGRQTLSTEDRKKLLDLMVSEKLIDQAAEHDNVTVSQTEINARIAQAKQMGGAGFNLNRELSDQELRSLVAQSGLGWNEYLDELRKTILQQKYVMQKKRSFFESIPKPTEEEIEDFYQSNKAAFVSPDMVRFKHIFIDTRALGGSDERDKAKARAEEIYRELRNGASFDELVVKYSDDKSSRYQGGDFGYLRRDDQARRQLLGKDFFEAPFKMEVGEVSGVLKSNIGYHIIKITDKIPFKLLGLDDTVPPQNKTTVRQEISLQLMQRKQAEYYQKAILDLLDELKKKAEIKIFDENLNW